MLAGQLEYLIAFSTIQARATLYAMFFTECYLRSDDGWLDLLFYLKLRQPLDQSFACKPL